MELHGTLDPSDYTLVLSTYVPFGYAGDRSSYPIERSTEYMRGTQTLRAVTSIQAKRIVQASSMFSDVDENAKSSVFADESTSRSTSSESSADVSTYRSNVSRGHEYARVPGTPGFFGIAERTTYTDRETSNVESGQESRIEHSIGSARERQHSEREQSERNVRTSATREQGSTIEVTQEVSFVAVGIDYTDADKLWEVWRRDPANRDVAIAVELMLSSFASLSGQIEDSNAARRRLGRDSATPALGNELTQRFWEQAAKLIPLDLDGSLWPRKILSHDGRPKAIGVQDIEAALRASRREIGSAAEIGRKLFE
jgi:hypothetical protein